ncbi:MAG: hypothetical protein IJG54_01045 [Bacteroidales bacterium]|nr:hypothetical protein [Bacteroidales bacterium]
MKICRHITALFAVAVAALSSCSKVEPKEVVFEEKDKTILLYFASHNNLYADAASNIKKIVNGYVPDDGNIVLYCNNFDLDSKQMKDTLPLLVNVCKDKSGSVKIDTIYRFPYINSCTKNQMKSVLNITKTICPAKEYGLVLWSHGTGWLPVGYYKLNPSSTSSVMPSSAISEADAQSRRQASLSGNRPLFPEPPGGVDPYAHMVKSFGSELKTEMSIFDIQEAIGDTHFDFIALDACLMGGIEVLYQLKDCCDYIISSPAEILTDSFPYDKVIQRMFNEDYTGVAKDFYDYYNALSGEYRSATISTVKCSELEAVAAEARKLFDKYRGGIPSLDITAVQRYFRYNDHWFYDFKDYLDVLCGKSETVALGEALNKAVLAKYTTGLMISLVIDPAKFSGLSSYINNPEEEPLTAFYQKYAWNDAVGMIVGE